MRKPVIAFAVIFIIATVAAKEYAGSVVTSTPQWEKLKSLIGEWNGYPTEGGKKPESHVSVRMTGDGSAIMHWMDAGTPHEMVTMFHMDQADLVATHYCSAHNQPRLKAVPSSQATQIEFQFKDGTNIRPGDSYMKGLVITFVDADHHNETWSYDANGKIESGTFYMTRSRQQQKGK